MAILARSISHGGIRAAEAINGHYPAPVEMYGYLTENDSYPSGGVLRAGAVSGELSLATAGAAAGIASDIMVGILPTMSPRRQDLAPLATATTPASALPGQRTLPAGITPNYADPADEAGGGQVFHPFLPGQIFAGHLVDGTAQGTDLPVTAAHIYQATDLSFAETLTAGAADLQVNYATKADEYVIITIAAALDHLMILAPANPQPISWLTTASVQQIPRRFAIDAVQSNQLVFCCVLAAGSRLF
jgi:hypothetical protein